MKNILNKIKNLKNSSDLPLLVLMGACYYLPIFFLLCVIFVYFDIKVIYNFFGIQSVLDHTLAAPKNIWINDCRYEEVRREHSNYNIWASRFRIITAFKEGRVNPEAWRWRFKGVVDETIGDDNDWVGRKLGSLWDYTFVRWFNYFNPRREHVVYNIAWIKQIQIFTPPIPISQLRAMSFRAECYLRMNNEFYLSIWKHPWLYEPDFYSNKRSHRYNAYWHDCFVMHSYPHHRLKRITPKFIV